MKYRWPHSLGGYYAGFTEQLGFVPDFEEGKVAGLAAYGDPSRLYLELLSEFRLHTCGSFEQRRIFDPARVRDLINRHGCADVAATLQVIFEMVLVGSLEAQLQRTDISNVCLAGGSMANVRLTQAISEIPKVNRVFVFPGMGDGGTGYGAACLAMREVGQDPRHQLTQIYLSREFSEADISRALASCGHEYWFCDNVEQGIAELLARNQIVARWHGRMEFGPRALGNRSILANPATHAAAEGLNEKLRRSEFMPFAPSTTLDLARKERIQGVMRSLDSAQYMTTALYIDASLANAIPAAIHVDGTARLQIVTPDQNPSLHRIISYFHVLTGLPAVLNTSFNMHGEPIVYSPDDALRTFRAAGLNWLAIGNYLVHAGNDARQGEVRALASS